jgi:hypothetical protein
MSDTPTDPGPGLQGQPYDYKVPWTVRQTSTDGLTRTTWYNIHDANGRSFARLGIDSRGADEVAHKIAAAPDLLHQLQRCLNIMRVVEPHLKEPSQVPFDLHNAIIDTEGAIAKAESTP